MKRWQLGIWVNNSSLREKARKRQEWVRMFRIYCASSQTLRTSMREPPVRSYCSVSPEWCGVAFSPHGLYFSQSALMVFLPSACLLKKYDKRSPCTARMRDTYTSSHRVLSLFRVRSVFRTPHVTLLFGVPWFCFLWLIFWLVWPLTVPSGYWNEIISMLLTFLSKFSFL